MTASELAHHRLVNQQLATSKFKTAKEVVGWMCAMQAQDYQMAKWGIGVRLSDTNEATIEQAINRGEIIRTHVMRPTWHFVLAEDLQWMIELTAPHINSSIKSSQKKMGLDVPLFKKTNSIIEKALRGHKHLTRDEIMVELNKSKINPDPIQGIHIMMDAELSGIICSGPMRGKQFTYALTDERVSKTKKIKRDEALAELALRYFTSHAPATLQDFMWWSGLPAAVAKAALDSVMPQLQQDKIENKIYLGKYFEKTNHDSERVYFLPSFDEFMISYKDRSATLDSKNYDSTITRNGIFKPIIVANGKAIGIWSRAIVKNKVVIEPKFFRAKDKLKKSELKNVLEKYGRFLDKNIEIK
ncbi:MAG: winged helix DNA-binding domain-containing protein [Cyclobacteriaceae bacterium]